MFYIEFTSCTLDILEDFLYLEFISRAIDVLCDHTPLVSVVNALPFYCDYVLSEDVCRRVLTARSHFLP